MSEIRKAMIKISSLEELTNKDTVIHRLHPAVKLLTTMIYLIIVISFGAEKTSGLIPFVLFPVLWMTLGEIPLKTLLQRLVIALPFSLVACLSNMLFSREVALQIGTFEITSGMLVFLSVMLKTILTVTAVLILIATTTVRELLNTMVRFHLPSIMILQLTMTFRYLGILLEEASTMHHAYLLRSPKEKGIKLADIGPFLGQLIIRSFDRAERVYHAMKCRGFDGAIRLTREKTIPTIDIIYLVISVVLMILLRRYNFSEILGGLFLS